MKIMKDFRDSVAERFLRYTKFDTMSDPSLAGVKRPTTDGQKVLLEALRKELDELGLETYLGEEWVVMGTLKGNAPDIPAIGFMAHVDTADDVCGNGVKARRFVYEGGDIALENGTVIRSAENPDLAGLIGHEIITSDGTTLLGADDKAGVSEIMEAVKYLTEHPEIRHGDIEIYFTPDEETGSGMMKFPHDRLKSKCCYTLDGGRMGEVEAECFNAATITLKVSGVSMHLGSARGKLVNAITVLSHIVTALPMAESPEATDGRYGYYCVLDFSGTATEAEAHLFIRDFDEEMFAFRISESRRIADAVASIYHAGIEIKETVSYRNMANANKKCPEALVSIFEAGKAIGLDLYETIIRGGTDGARLAETGVACPNIFTGGHNFHSLEEWIAPEHMSDAVNLVLSIISWWADR